MAALLLCRVHGVGAQASGELDGRVVRADNPSSPIAGATVVLLVSGQRVQSDSAGRFRLRGVARGVARIVVRADGFTPDTADIEMESDLIVTRDFPLLRATTVLAERRVVGTAFESRAPDLSGFSERRRRGIGHFLDESEIARWENHRTGDLLRTVAGVDVKVGGSKAWVSGGRALGSGRGAFSQIRKQDVLDRQDIAAGAPLACYMDVYVDGALVYNSSVLANRNSREVVPLYDVNSIPPSQIRSIEVYTGPSQVPPEYNRSGGGCGVLLIWTRAR
ncbi:MAG: TonB-dependent receptor [Gemmatimonadaceae bacterium]|nr:TonB-dependent receptor [Gemmatimonadaceae bacterium]